MLIDRGGKAYHATIHYPEGSEYTEKTVITPDFSSHCVPLSVEYTNKILGLNLTGKRIAELLEVAGLGISKVSGDSVSVLVPFYRIDVNHQVDLIEDVAIAYGYNNIEPNWRELPTIGRAKADQHLINLARDLMIGLGYQEILNYTLTNQENLFDKMNVQRKTVLELCNPKVVTMTCLRNWLLPGLMEFLSINQSVEFPQKSLNWAKSPILMTAKKRRFVKKNGLQLQQPMQPLALAKSSPL
jgi:phenylalanyl-tRNA synthetase beta chain